MHEGAVVAVGRLAGDLAAEQALVQSVGLALLFTTLFCSRSQYTVQLMTGGSGVVGPCKTPGIDDN